MSKEKESWLYHHRELGPEAYAEELTLITESPTRLLKYFNEVSAAAARQLGEQGQLITPLHSLASFELSAGGHLPTAGALPPAVLLQERQVHEQVLRLAGGQAQPGGWQGGAGHNSQGRCPASQPARPPHVTSARPHRL